MADGAMSREAVSEDKFRAGFHVAPGRAVNASAYDRYIGRWSRLFVPSALSTAEVASGSRMFDVSAGTGEAALMALPIFGASGFVIGADISPAMLEGCACPDTRAVVLAGGR